MTTFRDDSIEYLIKTKVCKKQFCPVDKQNNAQPYGCPFLSYHRFGHLQNPRKDKAMAVQRSS